MQHPKRFHIIVLCILTLALVVSVSDAFKEEPDGFRGIKWGTDISTLKNLKVADTWKVEGMEEFIKDGDELAIGDAKLKSINYYFWKGKFAQVRIEVTENNRNINKLSDILVGKFGTPEQVDYSMPMPNPLYYWEGKTTRITLQRQGVSNFFNLWFESLSITKECYKDNLKIAAQKAEEEKRKIEKRGREATGF